jgi:hypothetical protein
LNVWRDAEKTEKTAPSRILALLITLTTPGGVFVV